MLSIFTYLYFWTRSLIKWFLRRMTRLCELQRICCGEPRGASRALQVESSLDQSRSNGIIRVLDVLNSQANDSCFSPEISYIAAHSIIGVKGINISVHTKFHKYLEECLNKIFFYKSLMTDVELMRSCKYDPENERHADKLLELWLALNPDSSLIESISIEWRDIGFQGEDPSTDFRGMGMLGLENLLYFSQMHPDAARHVLVRSQHPSFGYSFAIVGINITSIAYTMLKDGSAKTHFYNSKKVIDITSFHDFYCFLFFEFDILWRKERPQDIMQFGRIRDKFESKIRHMLKSRGAFLKCKFIVEEV